LSCFHLPRIFAMTRLWSTSTSTRRSVTILISCSGYWGSCFNAWDPWWPKKHSWFLVNCSLVEWVKVRSLVFVTILSTVEAPRSHHYLLFEAPCSRSVIFNLAWHILVLTCIEYSSWLDVLITPPGTLI
jgi:hypothetical protein